MAVVENMSFFEVDGVKHFPFGKGSGDRIVSDFGLSNLIRFPIVPELSAAGDGTTPPPPPIPFPSFPPSQQAREMPSWIGLAKLDPFPWCKILGRQSATLSLWIAWPSIKALFQQAVLVDMGHIVST